MANNKHTVASQTPQSFEDAMQSLEDIVKCMEGGDLPLESALAEFEKGIELVKNCEQKLKQAEQKVSILMGSGEQAELSAFNTEDDAE